MPRVRMPNPPRVQREDQKPRRDDWPRRAVVDERKRPPRIAQPRDAQQDARDEPDAERPGGHPLDEVAQGRLHRAKRWNTLSSSRATAAKERRYFAACRARSM